jgi:hypothetical protein
VPIQGGSSARPCTSAQIAGINAAKQTHMLIPLCHQLLLRKVSVELTLDSSRGLHSFPFTLNLSLLCPFPLNLSLLCPPYNPN